MILLLERNITQIDRLLHRLLQLQSGWRSNALTSTLLAEQVVEIVFRHFKTHVLKVVCISDLYLVFAPVRLTFVIKLLDRLISLKSGIRRCVRRGVLIFDLHLLLLFMLHWH